MWWNKKRKRIKRDLRKFCVEDSFLSNEIERVAEEKDVTVKNNGIDISVDDAVELMRPAWKIKESGYFEGELRKFVRTNWNLVVDQIPKFFDVNIDELSSTEKEEMGQLSVMLDLCLVSLENPDSNSVNSRNLDPLL